MAVGMSSIVGVRRGVRVGGGVSDTVVSSLVLTVIDTESDFDNWKVNEADSVCVHSSVFVKLSDELSDSFNVSVTASVAVAAVVLEGVRVGTGTGSEWVELSRGEALSTIVREADSLADWVGIGVRVGPNGLYVSEGSAD